MRCTVMRTNPRSGSLTYLPSSPRPVGNPVPRGLRSIQSCSTRSPSSNQRRAPTKQSSTHPPFDRQSSTTTGPHGLSPNADPASIGEPRPGVRVLAYVPQRAVLERCAVVVCHGGYGTVLDSVDAAVPLVVVPFGADQHVNAAAIERLGIGIVIDEESLSPQTIRDAVDSLLNPRSPHCQRLEALREEWRALPGPAQAAESVIALAGSGGSAARVVAIAERVQTSSAPRHEHDY